MMRHSPFLNRTEVAHATIGGLPPYLLHGEIAGVAGLSVEIAGLGRLLSVGDRISLQPRHGAGVSAEVVGFRNGRAQAMVQAASEGLGPGSLATADPAARGAMLAVSDAWLGRVIDPLGRPLDRRGTLPRGSRPRRLRAEPPAAATRARLGPQVDLGVTALDSFATCRAGQRLGLFAGSGIGKSTLLAMLARHTACDVAVLALVGERGREVREFLEDDLGADAARCVTVVATSDASPLLRRDAAYAAMTVAEHFRDQGRSVLLLMDSVTRFCLALREIGLAAGEPPATRGYPPSVFAELPKLLERAGPGPDGEGAAGVLPGGQITALFTVLVEGDDHNEPVADAVRGILDGHVILDRRIADGGRYPAVDVLRSLSRTAPGCMTAEHAALARRARSVLARYAELADLVRLGAYQAGADPESDAAIALAPRLEAWMTQGRNERRSLQSSFAALATILDGQAA